MTSPTGEDGVHCSDAIGWCLNFDVVDGFEQSRSGEEETGVADTTGGGDDLTTSSEDWFLSKAGVEDSEFDSSDSCTECE